MTDPLLLQAIGKLTAAIDRLLASTQKRRIVLEFDLSDQKRRYDVQIQACVGILIQNQGPSDAQIGSYINLPAGDQITLTAPFDDTEFAGGLSVNSTQPTTLGIIYFRLA